MTMQREPIRRAGTQFIKDTKRELKAVGAAGKYAGKKIASAFKKSPTVAGAKKAGKYIGSQIELNPKSKRFMTGKAAKPTVDPTGMSPRGQPDPTRRPKATTAAARAAARKKAKEAALRAKPTSALQTGPEGRPQPVGPTSQKKIRKAVLAGMGSKASQKRPAMGVGPEGRKQPIGPGQPGQPRQKAGPRAIRKPEESYRRTRRKEESYRGTRRKQSSY